MVNTNLDDILDKVAQKLGISDYEVNIKPGNKKGEGYLGEITFLDLIDRQTGKCKSIIVKKAFTNATIRETAPIRRTFLNEIHFYTNILPKLQNFAQEIGIKVLDFVPKCYLTVTEEGRECLVMDNLKSQGFELFDKKKIVDFEHMELIYRTYAQLHATSILFRIKKPVEYQTMVDGLFNIMNTFFESEHFRKMMNDICKMVGTKLIPGVDDAVIRDYKKFSDDAIAVFTKSIPYTGQYPVLCHGDCWSNNMMFKYNATGKLEDMKLIDWQILKSGSVSGDLSYSLYSGADKTTFDRLEELLAIYYDTFSSIFQQVGEDSEKIYPLSIIKEEWKHYATYGIVMGIMIIRGKTTEDNDLVDLTDLGESQFDEEMMNKLVEGSKSEEFDKRVRDLLIHCHEIGCL